MRRLWYKQNPALQRFTDTMDHAIHLDKLAYLQPRLFSAGGPRDRAVKSGVT